MGLIRDLSAKYLNALISDGGNVLHLVHVKYTIGDYFTCIIDKQTYVFRIQGPTKKYQEKLRRRYEILLYDTRHYSPINDERTKELQDVLIKNHLPKVNGMLYSVFRILGSREKDPQSFKTHNLKKIFQEVADKKSQYALAIRNIRNYLDGLNIDEIVTPVKSVADFITDDIIATNPGYLGNAIALYTALDIESKKITNTPPGPRKPLMKIMILALLGVVLVVGAYYMSTNNTLGNLPGSQFQKTDIAHKYPTPEKLHAAVDRGEIKYSDLDNVGKDMYDSYVPPTVTPSVPNP